LSTELLPLLQKVFQLIIRIPDWTPLANPNVKRLYVQGYVTQQTP